MSSIRKRTRREDEVEDFGGEGSFDSEGRPGRRGGKPSNFFDSKHGGEDLRLFVGNIQAANVTEAALLSFLNNAMRQARLVGAHDPDPIISCTVSNKFGYIDFRDAEACAKGLNLNNLPFMGFPLKVGRASKYADMSPWQGQSTASSRPAGRPSLHPVLGDLSTKLYRELFIGNCTADMTEQGLQDFLGAALYRLGMSNSAQENPVMVVKNSGKFAFIVLRSVEEAANLLNLNRIPYQGFNLKFERPAKFDGGIAGVSHYQWEETYRLWMTGELKLMTAGNPTKVVRLVNQTTLADLQANAVYVDLLEDTRAECATFGTVRSVILPRTSCVEGYPPEVEPSRAFVEMASVEDAKAVVTAIKGRSFNGRWVDVKFYPEDRFRAGNYSFEPPGVVVTSSYGPVFKEQVLNPATLQKVWASQQHD